MSGASLLLAAAAALTAAPSSSPSSSSDILFHADLDGNFAVPDCGRASAAATDFAGVVAVVGAAVRRSESAGRARPLVLLGGNTVAPGLLARGVLKRDGAAGAEDLAALLALTGYQALVLGHHDLSLERTRLERFVKAVTARGIAVVGTNFRCDPAVMPLCASVIRETIIERGGRRIGILATLSPRVLPGIPRENRAGLTLEPPLAAVRAGVSRLRARGVQEIVLLTQGPRSLTGLEETLTLQRDLANGPAPDVVLAGGLGDRQRGEAFPVRLLRRDGAPPVVGSAEGTASVAQVQLGDFRAGVEAQVTVLPVVAGERDPRAAALLAPHIESYCSRYGAPVGPGALRRPLARDDWVEYVLAVMRRRAGAEIALLNRDFIKSRPFPIAGTLRLADLLRAMPYHAPLGRGRLVGAELEAKLGPALGREGLAALGIVRAADGSITVNGRPVDRARSYSIASIPFVAEGGDELLAAGTLSLTAVAGAEDVREVVQAFVETESGLHDGDPGIDPRTDFGPPASARPLVVGMADLTLDLAETSIRRQTGYTAPQLTRAEQRSFKGDLTGGAQLRSRLHEADGRLKLLYGWARSRPPGEAAVSAETGDLVSLSTLYNFRGLRDLQAPVPRTAVPDPYARLLLESELTRPDVAMRDYRHAELTATAGVLFTLTPKLRLRGGPGVRQQLLASGDAGRARPLVEAGVTLDPVVLASFGPLSTRFEALADYVFVDPARTREHQLKASARLTFPLLPLLFLTTGVDLFGMRQGSAGWGLASDTSIGLRLHLDAARQLL